ncbi:hypothetical protein HMPREF1548_06916, partial [Clostridium sp. KLE 1755]
TTSGQVGRRKGREAGPRRLKHIWGGNCSVSRIHDYETASFQSGEVSVK